MEIEDTVNDMLSRSAARIEERKALWTEVITAFEGNGATASTQILENRAKAIKSKFEKTLLELRKKL